MQSLRIHQNIIKNISGFSIGAFGYFNVYAVLLLADRLSLFSLFVKIPKNNKANSTRTKN